MGTDNYLVGLADRGRAVSEALDEEQAARAAAAGPLAEILNAVHLRGLWPDLGIAERRRLLEAGLGPVVLFAGKGVRRGRSSSGAASNLTTSPLAGVGYRSGRSSVQSASGKRVRRMSIGAHDFPSRALSPHSQSVEEAEDGRGDLEELLG
jgi:hypothetical protein